MARKAQRHVVMEGGWPLLPGPCFLSEAQLLCWTSASDKDSDQGGQMPLQSVDGQRGAPSLCKEEEKQGAVFGRWSWICQAVQLWPCSLQGVVLWQLVPETRLLNHTAGRAKQAHLTCQE